MSNSYDLFLVLTSQKGTSIGIEQDLLSLLHTANGWGDAPYNQKNLEVIYAQAYR